METALVLLAFLMLVLVVVDLGIGLHRLVTITDAARHLARRAIVHGTRAMPEFQGGCWKPPEQDRLGPLNAAAAECPLAQELRGRLAGCPAGGTEVLAEWLDEDAMPGARVRVTVVCRYRPVLASLLGRDVTLRASSTMAITH